MPFPAPQLEGQYGEVLRSWTREQAVYQGLETRAFTQVIYLARPLVDVQAEMISSLRAETAHARERTLERMRRETATPTFFVGTLDPKTRLLKVSRKIVGAKGMPVFQEALDAALTSGPGVPK